MASTPTPTPDTATNGGDLNYTNNDGNVDRHENGTTSNDNDGPLPTVEQVLQCQFSAWYPTFSNVPAAATVTDTRSGGASSNRKRRTNVTLKSVSLPLSEQVCEQFRAYLSADGVHLPVGANVSNCMLTENANADEWSSDDDSGDDDSDIDNDNTKSAPAAPLQFHFDDLTTDINTAIASLGDDGVVPKLNWSCPKDAVWINNGTLRCRSAGDVYLLLKASDFCSFDAQHALLDNVNIEWEPEQHLTAPTWPLEIVLRKWANLHPSQEFRCFVRDGELVAISQRQHSQHYAHTVRDQYLNRSLLVEFFDDVVVDNFPVRVSSTTDAAADSDGDTDATESTKNYVFDAYIDKKERVWLLDFNVWGRQTDALLFDWSELLELAVTDQDTDQHQPTIRVVETDRQVRQDPLASYRAPIDTVHVASMTGGDASKFDEFMTLCEKPSVLEQEEQQQSSN
jgi:hypothetical protein